MPPGRPTPDAHYACMVSEQVSALVRAAIEDHGPIGFDEYIRLALYGPGGFFETPPVGSDGHFVTGPHVHPFVFSHCVREALLDAWLALGEPDPFPIVELGAGDGTLAEALMTAFGELPMPVPAYTAVEISAGARTALAARGLVVVEHLDELAPVEGVVFANELLDNLPFLAVRGSAEGVHEVRVGLDDGSLVEVEVPWSRELEPPSVRPGEDSTLPVGAFAMLESLSARLARGYVLLIDYGGPGEQAGGVHGYRAHREVADVLSDPGGTDITAGIDVAAVAAHAESLGFQAFEPVRQADALAALGHERWARSMVEQQGELQRAGRGSEAVGVWQTRTRAGLLADPAGLGRFWWMVLATEGLPPPGWLQRIGLTDRSKHR